MRIPILHPDHFAVVRSDYVLMLPWNLKDEILAGIGKDFRRAARFVVPLPKVQVLSS